MRQTTTDMHTTTSYAVCYSTIRPSAVRATAWRPVGGGEEECVPVARAPLLRTSLSQSSSPRRSPPEPPTFNYQPQRARSLLFHRWLVLPVQCKVGDQSRLDRKVCEHALVKTEHASGKVPRRVLRLLHHPQDLLGCPGLFLPLTKPGIPGLGGCLFGPPRMPSGHRAGSLAEACKAALVKDVAQLGIPAHVHFPD